MRFIKDCLAAIRDVVNKFKFDANDLIKISISSSEIKVPTDIQDHWAEAVTLLASGARVSTAAVTTGEGSEVDVGRFLGGVICLSVTAVSGTFNAGEGLRVYVVGIDETFGEEYTLFDSYDVAGDYIQSTGAWFLPIDKLWFRIVKVKWEIKNAAVDASFTFGVSIQAKS